MNEIDIRLEKNFRLEQKWENLGEFFLSNSSVHDKLLSALICYLSLDTEKRKPARSVNYWLKEMKCFSAQLEIELS